MWNVLVKEILERGGLSEVELAKRVQTSQPTINRIKNGQSANIRHALGESLRALHKEIVT